MILLQLSDPVNYPHCYGTLPEMQANTIEDRVYSTTAICTYPQGVNVAGLWDMAGNVWEWTSSKHEDGEGLRVLRGGSWYNDQDYAQCAYRLGSGVGYSNHNIGFRLVSPSVF